ncbi:MAG TPA: hypothetical protein VFP72_16455 [Kineosporiaceae bacterium]|nr:hypothetical protein [Kineosporiaceae bacterium]
MYVWVSTHDLLSAQIDLSRGRTQDIVILEAVDRQADRLREHFQGMQPKIGRFSGVQRKRRQSHPERQVAISPRLTEGDLAILDEMWQEAGASSRSTYVNTALRFEYGG